MRTPTSPAALLPGRLSGRLAVAGVVAALTLLAGCGDEDGTEANDPAGETTSGTPSPTESTESATPTASAEPKQPQCAEVWVDGAKLPGGYQECYDGDQRVKADGRYCEFGKPLVTYDGRFWAVPKGTIHEVEGELLDDAGYQDALAKCTA